MSEWKEIKLGDIVTFHYGKALKTQERIEGDIPVYSSAGITGYHNKSLVNSKGIIVGRKGTIGKVYKSEVPFYCIDTAYYILPDDNIYDLNFLYYALQTLRLDELNSDSAVPGLNRNAVYDQKIILPILEEQRAIASVLSSLDDKIDLLHRQNQTLEQMAETLFRQWFVEEADESWEEGDIYKVLNVVYGYPFKSKRFNEEGIGLPVIRIRDLKKGESQFYTDEECDSKFEINCGDLIAGMDGEFRLYLWKGEKSLLNQRVCKFEPKDHSIPPLFIFGLMKPHLHYYENVKVGTTVIHLGKSDLDEIRIQVPDKNTLKEFGKITNPMFEKLKVNYTQIRTLTALRDTLLPKLMSGEIRIDTDE